jgi:hypothetical protein
VKNSPRDLCAAELLDVRADADVVQVGREERRVLDRRTGATEIPGVRHGHVREEEPLGVRVRQGRSSTPRTIENTAVFAPIPRASVAAATAVKPGCAAERPAGDPQVLQQRGHYSLLRASRGSTREARRAGR